MDTEKILRKLDEVKDSANHTILAIVFLISMIGSCNYQYQINDTLKNQLTKVNNRLELILMKLDTVSKKNIKFVK